LIEEGNREEGAASPESSAGDEDFSDSGEESSSSSDDCGDGDQTSGHEGNSPKVDITD
jgi:hypothetical protein